MKALAAILVLLSLPDITPQPKRMLYESAGVRALRGSGLRIPEYRECSYRRNTGEICIVRWLPEDAYLRVSTQWQVCERRRTVGAAYESIWAMMMIRTDQDTKRIVSGTMRYRSWPESDE